MNYQVTLLDSQLCLQTVKYCRFFNIVNTQGPFMEKPQFEIKNVLIEKFIFCLVKGVKVPSLKITPLKLEKKLIFHYDLFIL